MSGRSTLTNRITPREPSDDDAQPIESLLAPESPPVPEDTEADLVPIEDLLAEQKYFSFESLPPFPHPLRKPFHAAYWLFELAFGVVSLFALLAFLAAIPIANFLALGYLLDAEGRVARTGKLRYAMPLLPLAPKLGGIALGTWCWWWVVRLVSDAASDAALIAPGSGIAIAWRIFLTVLTVGVSIHLVLAIARGGRLGLFFWPTPLNGVWLWKQLRRGDYADRAGNAVRDFIAALRLRHHFWLGLRGFAGAFAWLFIPTALFAALNDTSKPGQVILTLLGGFLLVLTLSWVPFLQARFAAENRLSAMLELGTIRELFRRAPIVWFLAVVVLYALALPLYLFKLFEVPQDMGWMLTPIFIVSIYPAKILIGWAYSRAANKTRRGWLIVRWVCRLALLPLLGSYVFLLFFTPAVGAAGRAILFQHHAVLLPWPF
ncbi:MAG: DUF4013 domain-containing protein [Planctomycetota bacterium]